MKILIAIDSSIHSVKAAKYGLQLGQKLNAKIGIVSIIDKIREMGNVDAGILPDEARIILHKEVEMQIENIIQENANLNFEKFILDGNPVKDIVKVATEWNADLLVVGSHGDTGMLSRIMGSVTESIIRKSTVPTIIISPNMVLNV